MARSALQQINDELDVYGQTIYFLSFSDGPQKPKVSLFRCYRLSCLCFPHKICCLGKVQFLSTISGQFHSAFGDFGRVIRPIKE